MAIADEYRVQFLKSSEVPNEGPVKRKGQPALPLPAVATTAIRTLKKAPGGPEVISAEPKLALATAWKQIAVFYPWFRFGDAARWIDMWDVDHFDGVSGLLTLRGWFSAGGYSTWGSAETKTGRVNCTFHAPKAGAYVCVANLQSDGGAAVVECLIDSSSFGPLPFNGLIEQPHPCQLTAGYHQFRIRQQSGAFYFNSLTVFQIVS